MYSTLVKIFENQTQVYIYLGLGVWIKDLGKGFWIRIYS